MTQDKSQNIVKKKILVGMTGNIDSTVAAYLLKTQGYEVIGIGILFHEEFETKVDPKTNKEIKPFGVQFINNLDRVKKVCDELGIIFYGVHAEERYKSEVEDHLITARLGGITYSPLVFSTRLIIEILAEKMQALGADGIATGNYGKISIHPSTGAVGLGQSNDLANDESFQLARVRPSDAQYLKLPLSEMRRNEVLKIYKSLNLENTVSEAEIKGDKVNEILLMEDPRVNDLVKEKAPESLLRPGSIINYMEDSIICDHEGIYRYFIGQGKIKGKGVSNVDPKLRVVAIDPQIGDIYVCPPDELRFSFCELRSFSLGKNKNQALPVDAHVKFRPDTLKVPCRVYFGNNNSAILEFNKEQKGQLVPGQFVVLYDRQGEGAKVIGAGIVNRSGYLDTMGKRRVLPLSNIEKYDFVEDEKPKKRGTPFTY